MKSLRTEEKRSLEVAEAAREKEWRQPSFVGELFMGRLRPELIFPYPEQDPADKAAGDEILVRLRRFLAEKVDADRIDREKESPRRFRRPAGDGAVRHQDPAGIRRSGTVAGQLQPDHSAGGQPLRLDGGHPFRPSEHRRAAAAEDVRQRGAEEKVSATPGGRGHQRFCPDRAGGRLRSLADGHHRGAREDGQEWLHQRREAVDQQRAGRRTAGGDGEHQ